MQRPKAVYSTQAKRVYEPVDIHILYTLAILVLTKGQKFVKINANMGTIATT